MKIIRLAQRFELDFKIDTQEFTVEFELRPKDEWVTIGSIKKFRDKFDTQGQPIYQDENPKLYDRVENYIQEWLWT